MVLAAKQPNALEQQEYLIQALEKPECYPHPVESVRVVQTHVSWIILTGLYAYKIKKPVDFGFLDFTTLANREHFCQEELRLNRRFSEQLYLDVVSICGSVQHPRVGATGAQPVIEYAVKMRQFPAGQLLSDYADRHEVNTAMAGQIARQLAKFHQQGTPEPAQAQKFGQPEAIYQAVLDNFESLLRKPPVYSGEAEQQEQVRRWTEQEWRRLQPVFALRAGQNVRECHGDLHLGNIAWWNGQAVFFDCIEFNDQFRWIDTISELAFLLMDLRHRDLEELAQEVLNTYLQQTGDYSGLAVLNFYCIYRAMVRAKVCRLQLAQHSDQNAVLQQEYRSYLSLAAKLTESNSPILCITHGLSGSGKSFVSRHLARTLGAIHLRSDVERKRLVGLEPLGRSESEPGSGIYTETLNEQTYSSLWHSANAALNAGFSVIVDATFLSRACRDHFKHLAEQHSAPFLILVCRASDKILEERVSQRSAQGLDASEADSGVLAMQKQNYKPLDAQERSYAMIVETDRPQALAQLRQFVQTVFSQSV